MDDALRLGSNRWLPPSYQARASDVDSIAATVNEIKAGLTWVLASGDHAPIKSLLRSLNELRDVI